VVSIPANSGIWSPSTTDRKVDQEARTGEVAAALTAPDLSTRDPAGGALARELAEVGETAMDRAGL